MGPAGAAFGGCVISTIAGSFVVIADKHGALANSETFRPDLQYRRNVLIYINPKRVIERRVAINK
jgi:hypothetical protein